MTDWTEQPESIVLDVEPPVQPRERAGVVGTSFVIHMFLLALVVVSQATLKPKPAKNEPSLPLLFEEPVQPKPREHVVIEAPRFRPRPQGAPMPQPAPQPVPAPQQAQPQAPAQPAPPPPPKESPLIGWGAKGAPKGFNERPPGVEAPTKGAEAPGPKGKGMQDAGAAPDQPEPQQQASLPPAGPDRPEPQRAPSDSDYFPEPTPPAGSGERGGMGTRGSMRPNERATRPGPRGTGNDFNVGMGGGAFGDIMFDSGDYNWSDYSTKVYFAVYRAWLRELDGRSARFERDQNLRHLPQLEGEVAIHFVIHRDGSVDQIDVVRPSVLPTLDEASSAALRRAVLPPVPSDFPRQQEGVTFRFMIRFDSAHQLQRQLDEERYRGNL